jgi:hypothetical protein
MASFSYFDFGQPAPPGHHLAPSLPDLEQNQKAPEFDDADVNAAIDAAEEQFLKQDGEYGQDGGAAFRRIQFFRSSSEFARYAGDGGALHESRTDAE